MELTVTGRHVEVTQSWREHLNKKLSKLENHVKKDFIVHAVLSTEREDQVVEVKISHGSSIYRGKKSAPDMCAAIDLVLSSLEGQIKKQKERINGKRTSINKMDSLLESPVERLKRKRVLLEPISIGEAISQLENSGYTFLPFVDLETPSFIRILHQEPDGNYEIIEPYI
jgi:putative sigma-54 modulation protein